MRHETSDANIRGVFAFGAGLLVMGIVIHLVTWELFRFFEAREARQQVVEYPLAAAEQNRLPPEPRLQVNPRQDLRDLRTSEDQILETYGWIDRDAGTVRIPIDDAMRLIVQRGLPARKGAQRLRPARGAESPSARAGVGPREE